jgi:hypothetical protein
MAPKRDAAPLCSRKIRMTGEDAAGFARSYRRVGAVSRRAALVLAVCCSGVAGCGGHSGTSAAERSSGSGHTGRLAPTATARSQAVAPRVCERAASAAGSRLRVAVRMQVADADPAYLECLLDARAIHVDVVAQAIAQALGDYDTTLIHQVQTYVEPPPPSGVRNRAQLPDPIPGIGTKAAWIPGQQKLLATNGTPNGGGNFLSVTVTSRSTSSRANLALARVIAKATLAVAPQGPTLPSEH